MMKETKNNSVPLICVRTTAQRAALSERIVAAQTHTPASMDAGAQPAKSTRVVSSSAGDTSGKPIKRIGAADVEKILGAEAVAALERMRRGR